MSQYILMVFQVKFLATYFEITGVKNTNIERLPTQHKNPLPEIKLAPF